MKLTVSGLLIYRTWEVPALGAAQAAPPNPCRPFLFLLEEKEAKDYLGGYPLKTPRGSALAASPLHPHGRETLR